MSKNRNGKSPDSPVVPPAKLRKVVYNCYDNKSNESTASHSRVHDGEDTNSTLTTQPTQKLPEELVKSFCKTPGVLLISGLMSWDMISKKDPSNRTHPNLYIFHKFTERKYRLIVSGCSAGHSVLISTEGEAYTFGRNTHGQLGFGDTTTRYVPKVVPALKGINIIHAAVGRHHTLFVSDFGTVYACGENKCGQCGIGNTSAEVLTPTKIQYFGPPIVKVGAGVEFSMILDINGTLRSFGLPAYGQLGHNTDGKYFVSSTKLSYHFETLPKVVSTFIEKTRDGHVTTLENVVIVDFSCGNNHTVAIDSKKRAYSWGFGGFGRLGHEVQKDEKLPRLIKYFDSVSRGVRSVHCGATYTLAVNEIGSLLMFGQTKRTGEANMYPKPVQDLAGWSIKSIGTGNTSIVVAADDSLIAWGVSPTYGELGLGELTRSSAKPKEVSRMAGLIVTQVALGYSHSMLLCDDSTDEVKQKLEAMPTFTP